MKAKPVARQWVALAGAVCVLALLPLVEIPMLSPRAVNTVAVLLATLILLVMEVFNVVITCLLSVMLLFSLNCVDGIAQALSGYSNHILYFTLASFGISIALQKSTLVRRMLGAVMAKVSPTPRALCRVFMACGLVLSSFISNVAAAIILVPYAQSFLEMYEDAAQKKRCARGLIICATLSTMMGGMMTPAGSSINLLALDAIERATGFRVPFVAWMAVGIPLALAMALIAYRVCMRVYPMEDMDADKVRAYVSGLRSREKCSGKEVFMLAIIICALAAWILSSWIPAINITVVAVAALTLLFLPGARILEWKEFERGINWGTFFIAGTMISVANAMQANGITERLGAWAANAVNGMSLYPACVALVAITFLVLLAVPVAPATVSVMAPIAASVGISMGVSPAILAMACGFAVCNCYLLPLDTVMVVAYSYGAFDMFELPRVTIWIQLAMIAVAGLWIPFAGTILGL